MNLIPESNGIKKIRMRREVSKGQRVKGVFIVIASILLFGIVVQLLSNFIGNEKISSSLYYANIDSKKMEYELSGSGDYTIVFDGAIGGTLYEWADICDELEENYDVQTFVYNRRGYGFSASYNLQTPEEQAEDLKILLRKAGVTGNIILVGEEYGSLITTNFAKLYPDIVKGVVLVNPYSESTITTDEFRNSIRSTYYETVIESLGTRIGLTMLLDKFGLTYDLENLEESIPSGIQSEFSVLKNQSSYRQAISNEIKSLYNYSGNSQEAGTLSGIPLYIITQNEEEPLSTLGSSDLTTIYTTDSEGTFLSLSNPDSIITGVNNVLKSAKKIAKQTS